MKPRQWGACTREDPLVYGLWRGQARTPRTGVICIRLLACFPHQERPGRKWLYIGQSDSEWMNLREYIGQWGFVADTRLICCVYCVGPRGVLLVLSRILLDLCKPHVMFPSDNTWCERLEYVLLCTPRPDYCSPFLWSPQFSVSS